MRFYWEKVESARNFCNKVYNAARFVLMNIPEDAQPIIREELLDTADKWILSRLNEITREVTDNLEDYELNLAAEKIYDFIWAEFCDWYIEMAKSALYGEGAAKKENVSAVLIKVLSTSMKLLHPFMPFITEELYQQLPGHEETIMLSAWPKAQEGQLYARECATMETIMDLVKNIRNIRADLKVPPAQRIEVRIICADPKALEGAEGYLLKLAGVEKTTISDQRGQALKSDVHIVHPSCLPGGPRQGARAHRQGDRTGEGRDRPGQEQAEQREVRLPGPGSGGQRGAPQAPGGGGHAQKAPGASGSVERISVTNVISPHPKTMRRYGLANRTIFQKSY